MIMYGARAKRLFSRRLTSTSTQKRLPVPRKCLGDFPDFQGRHAVELQVRFEDDLYSMMCTTRTRGRYEKPVLSKGWIEFVRRTKLKVGDEVTLSKLQLKDGAETAYVIEVERAVLIKEEREINPTKEVEDTKPFALSWRRPPTCGPNINPFSVSSGDKAAIRSPDYDAKDWEQIGVPSKLEFMSSTMKKIDQSIGELAFDPNSVTAAAGGGSPVLDLTLKLGIL